MNKTEKVKSSRGARPLTSVCGLVLQVCAPSPAVQRLTTGSSSPHPPGQRPVEEATALQCTQGKRWTNVRVSVCVKTWVSPEREWILESRL